MGKIEEGSKEEEETEADLSQLKRETNMPIHNDGIVWNFWGADWERVSGNFFKATFTIKILQQFIKDLSLESNVRLLIENHEYYQRVLQRLIYYSEIQRETAEDLIAFLTNGTRSRTELEFEGKLVWEEDKGDYFWHFDHVEDDVCAKKIGEQLRSIDDLIETNKQTTTKFGEMRECIAQFLIDKLQNVDIPEAWKNGLLQLIERSVIIETHIRIAEKQLKDMPFDFENTENNEE